MTTNDAEKLKDLERKVDMFDKSTKFNFSITQSKLHYLSNKSWE